MTSRRVAIATATLLVVAACSDSNDPTSGCPKPVTITLTAGTKPDFTWTPACRAYEVSVNGAGGPVWAMGFKFGNPAKTNAITAPVTYGDTLAVGDTIVANPPAELTAGTTYTFYVFALTAVGQSTVIGQQQFTPQAVP